MKVFLLSIAILSSIGYCYSQNVFTNQEASFEFDNIRVSDINPCHFCQPAATGNWQASHNSPEIRDISIAPSIFHGSKVAYMVGRASDNTTEGIFFPFAFNSDRLYTVSFYVWQKSRLSIKLANNLVNNADGDGNGGSNINFPSTTDFQILLNDYTVPNGAGWEYIEIKNFQPNKDYNQLWIHSSVGAEDVDTYIDAGVLLRSCCIPYKIYQDTINPPSAYVTNYILAGQSVLPFPIPQGEVKFTQPWQTIWQAGLKDSNNIL